MMSNKEISYVDYDTPESLLLDMSDDEIDKLYEETFHKTKENRILNNKNVMKKTDDEYRKLVDKFVIKYEQGGVLKWIK